MATGRGQSLWLHHSMASLDGALADSGGRPHLAAGDSLTIVRELVSRSDASAVDWSRRYEPAAIAKDTQLKQALRADGITVESCPGNLWCQPWRDPGGLATRGYPPPMVDMSTSRLSALSAWQALQDKDD